MKNLEEYTLTLTRRDLCDLMLACTQIEWAARDEMKSADVNEYRRDIVLPGTVAKWEALHDKIEEQLDRLDAETEKAI